MSLVVIWRVTERCNLACPFCSYARDQVRPRRSADPDEIRRFAALLGAFQTRTHRPVHVSWLGGEPLLWSPLQALSQELAGRHGLSLGVTTNGTTLGSVAVREHLARFYDQVTLSVDGLDGAHDTLRGAPGAFAAFEASVPDLAARADRLGRSLLIRVNTVLMRETVSGLEDLGRRVASWGVRELTFNQLGADDRPEYHARHHLTRPQVDELIAGLPGMRARLARLGLSLCGSESYLRRLQASASGVRLPISDCHPGRDLLFIDERGRIGPCSFTVEAHGVPTSAVKDKADLAALPHLLATRRRGAPHPACSDCRATHVRAKFEYPKGIEALEG